MDAVAAALAALCLPGGDGAEVRHDGCRAAALCRGGRQPLSGHRQGSAMRRLKKVTPESQWAALPCPVRPGGGGQQPRRRPPVRAHPPGALRRGPRKVHGRLLARLIPTPMRARARAMPLRYVWAGGHGGYLTVPHPEVPAGGGHAPELPGPLSAGPQRRGGLHPRQTRSRDELGSQPGNMGFLAAGHGQGAAVHAPLWPTACCPARPSPWAAPMTSAIIWRPAASAERRPFCNFENPAAGKAADRRISTMRPRVGPKGILHDDGHSAPWLMAVGIVTMLIQDKIGAGYPRLYGVYGSGLSSPWAL